VLFLEKKALLLANPVGRGQESKDQSGRNAFPKIVPVQGYLVCEIVQPVVHVKRSHRHPDGVGRQNEGHKFPADGQG